MNAADLLKMMRRSMTLDVETVADLTGYTPAYVVAMETGEKPVSERYARRWAYVFAAPTSAADLGLPE